MKQKLLCTKTMVVLVLLLVGLSAKATTYYVRPFENTTAWSGISGATIYTLASGNAFAFTATYLASDTYYFAAGSYFIPAATGITITTGKIYGGFSGDETEIDLNARITSDKDGNGIVEPWEFTNETAITGNGKFATTGTDGRNFVTVTGGEINGITLQNHYYYKTGTSYAGTITLGTFTATPTKAIDIDANKGTMTLCTVKQIKSVNLGPIMLTNKNSVIDRCLIEECVTSCAAGSAAIYMPIVGGQILNSVIRNNVAIGSGAFGAIYATSSAAESDNGNGNMNVIVQNCVIYNNTAPYGAGIRAVAQASKRGIQIINCTLANNKTTTAGNSSVDLQNGGTFVNSVVVDDTETELRPTTADGYISNSAYGALYAGTSANVWPGTSMVSGKSASDFNFSSNSTTYGAMISGVAGTNTFVQADYDAIRSANYQITAGGSAAVATAGLNALPTSYQIGGTGVTITHTALVPATDITGLTRTGNNTLGAYQYAGPNTIHYVRPFANSTAWNNLPGATIYTLASGNAFAFTATYKATDNYYFAAGSYNIPSTSGISITTGKIYGGFSGNETEIDLDARITSDKDGNGIVEPWEFTNETAITGNGQFAGVGTNGRNFVSVTGGELNGITLQNHHYYKTGTNYAGTITLGSFTESPLKANDIDANKGVMTLCTVKQIKSIAFGPIMLTNKNSLIDRCLIEECVTLKAGGGAAIYMPIVGGQIISSVIRNNVATGSGGFGAIYATSDATNSDNGSGNMNVIVQNCVIYNNTATYGAGIRAATQAGKRGIQIVNCTFTNNKTTSVGNSTVDLQDGGTFVNSIVVDDPETELRPASANGYISNSAYGALYAGTSANVWPGTNMASGKSASDFIFLRNSTTSGAMISGVAGTNAFVQTDYDAIRKANYKISTGTSVAVTTIGLNALPTSYQVGGSGTTITHTATVPTTDITGFTRSGDNTLGAYQHAGVYVRPYGNSTAWNNVFGATIYTLAAGNVFSFDATHLSTDTYYLAAGSYNTHSTTGITLTTGKIYGGFSGNETTINLNLRATSDKDGNGLVEPWEFTNEAAIIGNGLFTGTGTVQRNFVNVTGGEINGITLQNHNYTGTSAGTITLGTLTTTPTIANDIDANKGTMTLCYIKQIKSAGLGPIMLTNKNSIIDKCLIEECVTTLSAGSAAIYLPIVGGQILNSVIRNNAATGANSFGAIYATTSAADSDNGNGNMNVIVKNSVIYNNTASYGAAVRAMAQAGKRGAQIINCTIANNKTIASGYSTVDLQNGGTFVNSVVVDDPQTELRPTTANGFISNSAYGALFAGTSANVWPGTNMAAGKVAANFNFASSSTTYGAMISGITGTNTFVLANYNAIRTANYKITASGSVAVTTTGLNLLPTTYQVLGSGTTITHTTTVPNTDISGLIRTGNKTLGAYQYVDLVTIDANGALTYAPDERGNIIPDFSGVGYRNGESSIPDVPVVLQISPVAGDNYDNVQNAINQVAAMPLQTNGFRGAILLKAGLYNISKEFKISTSGIVLRGEGLSTELRATATTKSGFLRILGTSGKTEYTTTRKKITDSYVPIGTKTITVEAGHTFVVGDWVYVRREPNNEWIKLLGMDKLTLIHPTDLSVYNWSASSYIVNFERQILNVDGNVLTLDAPIVDPIDPTYATGYVTRFSSARINNCGVENMKMISNYATTWDSSTPDVAHDQNHAFSAVYFDNAEHCWARKVNAYYFGNSCAYIESGAAFITVDSCALYDPISPIEGGFRYPFNIDGNRCLVKNCISRNGRHDFVNGARTAGPSVFYNCTSTLQHADTGPHHRWSTGILFDNISTNASINVQDRADSGSGHGWAGSQIMMWNCVASSIIIQDPPSNHCNWAIGCIANITNKGTWTTRPLGNVQSKGTKITAIPSLYMAQLNERLTGSMGVSRPVSSKANLELGAKLNSYFKDEFKTTTSIYAVSEGIRINDAKDNIVNVYSIAGQKIKSVVITSDNQTIPVNKGIYIVKVNSQVMKVIVK